MQPLTVTMAAAAAVGLQFNKSVSFSLRRCLFFNIWSSPPPPLRPPQTQIVFESRLGMHNVLNDCTMTVAGKDFPIP